MRDLRNRLVKISDDVLNVFQADRQAHHVGRGASQLELVGVELAVRGGSRVDDQRAGVADVGEQLAPTLSGMHAVGYGYVTDSCNACNCYLQAACTSSSRPHTLVASGRLH